MGARETKEMGKFTRFVENGRVVLVNFGPDAGKLAVVVDVVDSQRCLIVGPSTDVARQMIGYKRLSLTDIKVDMVVVPRPSLSPPHGPLPMSRVSGLHLLGARLSRHARLRPRLATSSVSPTW